MRKFSTGFTIHYISILVITKPTIGTLPIRLPNSVSLFCFIWLVITLTRFLFLDRLLLVPAITVYRYRSRGLEKTAKVWLLHVWCVCWKKCRDYNLHWKLSSLISPWLVLSWGMISVLRLPRGRARSLGWGDEGKPEGSFTCGIVCPQTLIGKEGTRIIQMFLNL